MIPIPLSDSSDTSAMTSNSMIQSLEDQFLHWRQDMEKKHEKQERQMKELQESAEHRQHENDCLWAKVEKRHDIDERDAQDSG